MNAKLRDARLRKGWTLEIASSKIGDGVHPNTLSAWEKGRHKPGITFLAELQRVYDASLDDFELTLWDGLTHYHLGSYKESLNSFLQIDGLQPKKPISERVRIEFLNNQALTELRRKERDMELALAYWQAAIQGAVALKSERRYSEACEVYRTMQTVWPEEKKIEDVRPLLKRWDD